tara:strand:+ start:287 stop:505 length:219 start_codon:yes stop_codon:yes gene_type:complete
MISQSNLQRNQAQSIDRQIRQLKKAIAFSETYEGAQQYKLEEVHFMKRSLRTALETREQIRQIQNGGFGYNV